jgi:hypothetical protein
MGVVKANVQMKPQATERNKDEGKVENEGNNQWDQRERRIKEGYPSRKRCQRHLPGKVILETNFHCRRVFPA